MMSTAAEVTFSPVVATVFNHVLGQIHDGTLQPGDRVSDADLAEGFGVSRTPVREALQKLRDIGVIEASANRFTRVAVVSPLQTLQALLVWSGLYGVLVEEVVADLTDDIIELMEQDHREYVSVLSQRDYAALANANFAFYSHLRGLSNNPSLVRAIGGVVHMIRLGSLHLPEAIDLEQLAEWQQKLLDAAHARDPLEARAAIDGLRSIRIPQE